MNVILIPDKSKSDKEIEADCKALDKAIELYVKNRKVIPKPFVIVASGYTIAQFDGQIESAQLLRTNSGEVFGINLNVSRLVEEAEQEAKEIFGYGQKEKG